MIKEIKEYQKEIKKQLTENRTYNTALDFQIKSLASAMRNLDLANRQIDELKETTVWEKTRYGEKLAPHPVFKIAKESQELITRQMKILGLTVDELTSGADDDPLSELTAKLIEQREQPETIKPKKKESK